jgi:hypothetical protein
VSQGFRCHGGVTPPPAALLGVLRPPGSTTTGEPTMTTTATTTEPADQARQLATAAADLHVRLLEHGHDGPTGASSAWLALDQLATELTARDSVY